MPRHATRRSAAVLVTLAVLVSVLGLLPGAQAAPRTTDAWRPVVGGQFNDPTGTPAQQRRLLDQIIAAVNHAPARSTIRMAVFSFADPRTADALIAAYRRGVKVKLIFSGNHTYDAMNRVRSVIGGDRSQKSYVYQCENSCRGLTGQMHAKYFSFGRTGAARFVTMVGSVNITQNNAQNQWSDLYTVADDQGYFKLYTRWFTQLKNDVPIEDPYLRMSDATHQVDFFPVPKGSTEDPVVDALNQIVCTVTAGQLDPAAPDPDAVVPTKVLIGAYAWNDERGKSIAGLVGGLQDQGCQVKVYYGEGTGSAVLGILRSHGVSLRTSPQKKITTHEKMMIVNGAYADQLATMRAWTGSQNWSTRALRRDDLLVTIADQVAADQYRRGFNRMWAQGITYDEANPPENDDPILGRQVR